MEQKIREVFLATDADAILKMPRPIGQYEDVWAWEYARTSVFTKV
jgi:hypothetical protein